MDAQQVFLEVLAINRAIASAGEQEEVLRQVVDRTAAFTRASACLLLLAEEGLARVVRSVGVDPEQAARLAIPLSERLDLDLRSSLGLGTRDAFVGVPVIGTQGLLGVLAVHWRWPQAPDGPSDVEVISAFADQAAIALENAERIRRLRASEALARRAARDALAQFHALSSMFDAMDVVLYVADLRTHELLFVNEYTARTWGPEVRVGRRCYEVLQGGQTAPCPFCTNHALVTPEGEPGPPVVWEFQNTVTDRWYLCIDRAIPWSDGHLVRLEVAVDITERKEAERFRQQYVSVISHDLCNPLAAITLRAAALTRELERKGLAGEAVRARALRQNAERMHVLLLDLVETTRLESGKIELHRQPIDLSALARRLAGQVGSLEDAARVRVEAPETVVVSGDGPRLERVLENLLSNAFRYSAPGTPIAVRVAAVGGEAVVSVEDRGRGVPAEELPRLFERFYRASTSRSIEGLGLGLYNSRLIVELHGGRIQAESQVDLGSTFSFALPLPPSS